MSDTTNKVNGTSESSTLSNNKLNIQSESVLDTALPFRNAEDAIMIFCSYSCCKKCKENVIHLQQCAKESCDKFVHQSWFQAMLKRNNVKDSDLATEPTEFLCLKHCLNLYSKNAKKQQLATLIYPTINKNHPWKQWTRDFGPSGKSSHDFIMDWLTMEGNYSKYVGGLGQEGLTKKVICTHIVKEISFRDISQTCFLEDVYKYNCWLEKQFHDGLDWLNQTGQGLEEGQIKDYLKNGFRVLNC